MNTSPRASLVEVDSDSGVTASAVCSSRGIETRHYDTLDAFLCERDLPLVGCVLAGVTVLAQQRTSVTELSLRANCYHPVIFIADPNDVPLAVFATRQRPEAILQKPINQILLATYVEKALVHSVHLRDAALRANDFRQRLQLLTPREKEILDLIMLGQSTREIAATLHRSAKTVEMHRVHVLHKLGARSSIDLVRALALIEGYSGRET
jgi:two-component system response regulator FixJ